MESGRKFILVADDEPIDRLLLQRAFAKLQLTVETCFAEDGEKFITELLRREELGHVPALFILDLKMPWRDGFETLRWLRSRDDFRSVPVVILSSSGLPKDRELAIALGATDYIEKPSSLAELCTHTERLAQRWHLMARTA